MAPKKKTFISYVSVFGLVCGTALTSMFAADQSSAVKANSTITMEFVGRAVSGRGLSGSEISAFDPSSKRLFVTNGATNQIDVFDISNPSTPTLLRRVDLAAFGVTGVQSVATRNGLVATGASMGGNNQAPGRVFLMDTIGNIDPRAPQGIEVGSLPDSVHFSPNGRFILSANEGEPRDYCLTNGELPTSTDPYGSVSIIDTSLKTLSATTLDFSNFNTRANEIRSAGARIYGPGATVAQDLEPEYIAISSNSQTAFVTLQENNAVAEIDLASKKIVRLMGLGYKDHSISGLGLDPSDQDSASNSGINIGTWPVKGMYQPDAIATFSTESGGEYFVTANEGDAREYKCLLGGLSTGSAQAEDSRVGSVGVDGTILDASVATNANLGRLGVTRFFPATYTNGGDALTAAASTDFTSLYTLGGRSLSVWKRPADNNDVASATLVADTGDTIERKIAELLPTYFNSDWNTSTGVPNNKDSRSDNKGPEPEGLAVGKVFGRTLAFVGLERIGGVMIFDITNPASPEFQSYMNSSVFTGVGGANFATAGSPSGDVSPEGILFVKASDSPIGEPLVMVANELSGTTSIYKVVGAQAASSKPTSVVAKGAGRSVTVSWNEPEDDGGRPITGYVAKSIPGGFKCVTTKTSCVISGLLPGVSYQFVVDVRVLGTTSVVSDASPSVATPLLDATAGVQIATGGVPKAVAQKLGIATRGRTFTAVVVAPSSRSVQRIRYSVELWSSTGEKVASTKAATSTGRAITVRVAAPSAGRYRVVVVSSLPSGKRHIWNGPLVTIN